MLFATTDCCWTWSWADIESAFCPHLHFSKTSNVRYNVHGMQSGEHVNTFVQQSQSPWAILLICIDPPKPNGMLRSTKTCKRQVCCIHPSYFLRTQQHAGIHVPIESDNANTILFWIYILTITRESGNIQHIQTSLRLGHKTIPTLAIN